MKKIVGLKKKRKENIEREIWAAFHPFASVTAARRAAKKFHGEERVYAHGVVDGYYRLDSEESFRARNKKKLHGMS